MPEPLNLDKLADEIVRIEYPTYEKSQLVTHVNSIKFQIKLILEQRIKSACEFFLRYKDNPELLIKLCPEIREIEYAGNKIGDLLDYSYGAWTIVWDDLNEYNEWLFKLAFADMFGDDGIEY